MIVFAKKLANGRVALIVEAPDNKNKLIAGVVQFSMYSHDFTWGFGGNTLISEFKIIWEWYHFIDNPEDFYANEGWNHPPLQIEHKKVLDSPRDR